MHRGGVASGLSLLLAFGVGCGAGSDPTMLPSGRWGVEWAAAECARIFSCCDADERTRWSYADEAQCREQAAAEAQKSLDGVLSIGWVTYDAKAARRCVDDIATRACRALTAVGKSLLGPSCAGVTRGTGKIGRTCEDLDVICESSNCLPGSGTCGPTRGCSVICAAGEFCDLASGACAPFRAEGAACAGTAECAFPLTCQSSGVCAPPRQGGAACASTSDCASGVCTAGVCGAMMCDGA